jgi:hypothetical protein
LDVVDAFLRRKATKKDIDASPCCFDGSLGCFSEHSFQFGEHLLEIGTVRREKEKPRAGRADGLTHSMALMAAEIVQNNDVYLA